jgi:HK97 family phage major capsid protein
MGKLKFDLQFFAGTTDDTAARIAEIKKEKRELLKRSESSKDVVEIQKIGFQLSELSDELEELRDSQTQVTRSTPQGQMNVLGTYGIGQVQQGNQRTGVVDEKFEQRSSEFENGKAVKFDMGELQIRSITVAGGNVALQTGASSYLQPVFNEVSALVDLVHSFPIPGGESYNQGFVVSSGSADYTGEGQDYHDNSEIETDVVNIVKAKITTYFELPEEVQKQGGSQYMTFAQQAALTAVRKKMSQQIIVGAGGTNALLGIFNAPVNVMPATVDLGVSTIDNQILDDIVFKHGGDESVEGGAYLILNKQTLAEFSKLRSTTGNRLYTIKLDKNGNSGTISSEDSFEVPFIINSIIKSFANAAVGEYFMAYGKPAGYEMPLFSGLEIQESKDFKFQSGQIAIRASVFAGGNTCCYKGFTRIKKVAAV